MRHWMIKDKRRQAQLIHHWKPWLKGGVKTDRGKAISKMNAYKDGRYTQEMRELRKIIAECRRVFMDIYVD